MAVGDVYQVDLLYSLRGEKCANVLHYQEDTSPASNPELSLIEAVKDDLWTAALRATMSNDCTLQNIRARRVDPSLGGPIMAAVNEAGSVAQDSLPPNSAVVMTWYTDHIAPSGRGRTFWPGVPKTHTDDGVLLESVVSLYDAVGTAMTTAVTEGTGVWLPGVWSESLTLIHPITQWVIRPWVHTLRGRRMAQP